MSFDVKIGTLHHCTKLSNLESILKLGLIPYKPIDKSNGRPLRPFPKGVYVEIGHIDSHWTWYATDKFKVKAAIVCINPDNLDVRKIKHDYCEYYFIDRIINPSHFEQIFIQENLEYPYAYKPLWDQGFLCLK
jgi:hypothetical protein